MAITSVVALTLAGYTVLTHRQVSVWRNTESLFSHAAKVTTNNYMALSSLANLDLERGHIEEATGSLTKVLEFAPGYPKAEYLIGTALQMQGKSAEAVTHFLAATDGIDIFLPKNARLTLVYIDLGRLTEAEATLAKVLAIRPGDPNALLMKAALLREQGQPGEALQVFRSAIDLLPQPKADNPTFNFEIGELFSLAGENSNAVPYYSKAIESAPSFTNALNNFAWILATDPNDNVRNGSRAVKLAERACALTGWHQPIFMGTLAAAYAEAGRFDDAVRTAERARNAAKAEKLDDVAKRNEDLLERYRANKPYREKTD